jgi:hypothetical protein
MITVGYQLDSDEEVILKPLYAHPDWSVGGSDRSPIDGLRRRDRADRAKAVSAHETITFSASQLSCAILLALIGQCS